VIPIQLLRRLAADPRIPASSRDSFSRTVLLDEIWRSKRGEFSAAPKSTGTIKADSVDVIIYDCAGTEIVPGTLVDPEYSKDGAVLRANDFTTKLAAFLEQCFSRNSIDNLGKALVSSVHFSRIYSNAYWSSELMQMVYGDGDGLILLDFTLSPEFIAHEVAHGLTQFTTELIYSDEPGALNESISDIFGSMFVQWLRGQDVIEAHWQIGPDLIGPTAKSLGWICVRDLAQPSATHSMTQQPSDYDHYIPGGDPHDNSGIPNHAFFLAAKSIGGRSWERLGQVWYTTILDPRSHEKMSFSEFALYSTENAIRLFPTEPRVAISLFNAWASVKIKF
jgi:Zn-dependent metalloprotease